jgi:hypothetical protein
MRTQLITEATLEQENLPAGRRADSRHRSVRNSSEKSGATESLNRSAALRFTYSAASNSAR